MTKNKITLFALPLTGFLCLSVIAKGQFYYKDLVSNRQLLTEMAQLKENKVRTVRVKSFEDDGNPSDGFFCEKKISRNYSSVEMFSRSNSSAPSLFSSLFNKKGWLEQTIDSSEISTNTIRYTYDDLGRIMDILSVIRSSDDDFTNEITEEHIYTYDETGIPVRMTQVKNRSDSTLILFSTDEKKNVSIEKNTRSGDAYYYYYDSRNRLTDIVRLNPFNRQLLPDYMFEYNATGQISQMTSTEEGGSYYFIWKYTYDNGLRIREKCFSKEKRLMGTIEYEYE